MVIPTLREWDLNEEEGWKDRWPCYPDHIHEVNHSIRHPQRHKPRVPRQVLSPQVSATWSISPLLFPLSQQSLSLTYAVLIYEDTSRSLRVRQSCEKRAVFPTMSRTLQTLSLNTSCIFFVQWTHPPKTLDLLLSFQGRFCCYFCFVFFFLKDVLPESSWHHIIRSY